MEKLCKVSASLSFLIHHTLYPTTQKEEFLLSLLFLYISCSEASTLTFFFTLGLSNSHLCLQSALDFSFSTEKLNEFTKSFSSCFIKRMPKTAFANAFSSL